jgi:hypothetical protein
MIYKHIILAAVLAGTALAGAPATAGIVYMTGGDPWENTTNDAAMDTAFGSGNWTKVSGYSASPFTTANSFVFVDGSDENGYDFASFLTASTAAITSYVNAGGLVFANMAKNNGPNELAGPFGSTYTSGFNQSVSLTAAGLAAGLSAGGAGSSWTGGSFGHDVVTGGTCYVSGSVGCVFAGGTQGSGAYFVGGQTTTNFHSEGGEQLLVNQLTMASGGTLAAGAVPEPASWAMMVTGFGLLGGAMRRRNAKVSFA